MAVYGRHREKWDPTKRKAKVSKNNTLELTGAADRKLLFYLAPENLSTTNLAGAKTLLSSGAFDDLSLSVRADSIAPSIVNVEATRFQTNAIDFPKDGDTGNRCYVESAEDATSLTADLIAGRDNERAYDTYISFWVKVPRKNFGTTTGHNLGGFYRSSTGSQTSSDADSITLNAANLSPAILFNITSTGTVSIRFKQHNNTIYHQYYESSGGGRKLQEGEWAHVTFVIKRIDVNGSGSNDYGTMVDIYIDGENTGTPSHTEHNGANGLDMFNDLPLELILGNQEFGYQSGGGTNVAESDSADGFEGAIGEFIIFTQPASEHASVDGTGQENTDGRNRRLMAKFIYEAQREGVYNLHSGIHSSSPRLEQLDLDKDSVYPSSFTLENYTRGEYKADEVSISKKSKNRFVEGYNTSDTGYEWKENASQYYVQTDTSSGTPAKRYTLPHLKLSPSDTLLTNGNWYSDERSEIFTEDLSVSADTQTGSTTNPSNVTSRAGFVVVSESSDELYKEHQTKYTNIDGSVPTPSCAVSINNAYIDEDLPSEYDDCFVIEIPLPNTSQLVLTTDGDSGNEVAAVQGGAGDVWHEFTVTVQTFIGIDYNTASFINQADTLVNTNAGQAVPATSEAMVEYLANLMVVYAKVYNGISADITPSQTYPNVFYSTRAHNFLKDGSEHYFWNAAAASAYGATWNATYDPIKYFPEYIFSNVSISAAEAILAEVQSLPTRTSDAATRNARLSALTPNFSDFVYWYHSLNDASSPSDPDPLYDPLAANPQTQGFVHATKKTIAFKLRPRKSYQTEEWIDTVVKADIALAFQQLIREMHSSLQGIVDGSVFNTSFLIPKAGVPGPDEDDSTNLTKIETDVGMTGVDWADDFEIPLTSIQNDFTGGTFSDQFPTSSITSSLIFMSGDTPSFVSNTNQSINTMAYYNFADGQWEHTIPSYSTTPATPKEFWGDKADIGFGPMSGLIVPQNRKQTEAVVDLYGRPTAVFGFPFDDKFKSNTGQTINLEEYLDEPVILEGWEFNTQVIPVVGHQHATWSPYPTSTGGEYYPDYYGHAGEAAVLHHESESSPFREYQKTVSTNTFRYNKTIPSDSATVGGGSAKGLITKGVTAFLLRENDIVDQNIQIDKLRSTLCSGSVLSNVRKSDNTFSAAAAELQNPVLLVGSLFDDNLVISPGLQTKSGASSYFNDTKSRDLLGYLQHVFHNEKEGLANGDKESYVRYAADYQDIDINIPRLESILNRENNTYIQDTVQRSLLRNNTISSTMHVSGSMKLQTPSAGSFPISNFFIRGIGVSSGSYRGATPSSSIFQDIYHSVTLFPSSINGVPSDSLISSRHRPGIIGVGRGQDIQIPKGILPFDSTTNVDNFRVTKSFSENPDGSSEVILSPSDNLILGIQDSVSTCFASQQIIADLDPNNNKQFVRWGRNTLTIPAQQDGYLRLFCKRMRNDQSISHISTNEVTFNQNVNRDIGDRLIQDKDYCYPAVIYSGSIADDIIGPTTFTPSFMQIQVNVDTNIANDDTASSSEDLKMRHVARNFAFYGTSAVFTWNDTPPFDANSTDKITAIREAIEGFSVKWSQLGHTVFADRGHTDHSALQQFPSIVWRNDHLDELRNSGNNDSAMWFNIYEMFWWTLADEGTDTLDAPQDPAPYMFSRSSGNWSQNKWVRGMRGTPYSKPSELNTNTGRTDTGHVIGNFGNGFGEAVDLSLMGYDNPAMSAFNIKVALPYFKLTGDNIAPVADGMVAEFRLVRILAEDQFNMTTTLADRLGQDPAATAEFAKRPAYTDGTLMSVGDAFYFDDNQNIIKLDLSLDPTGSIPANQKVLQNWLGQRTDGPIIYIVAGADAISDGYPLTLVKNAAHTGVLKYKNIYSIISRLLYIHSTWDESILCTVSGYWDGNRTDSDSGSDYVWDYGHDGNFSLTLPEDSTLREFFSESQTSINNLMTFELCGKKIDSNTIVGGDDAASVIDDKIYLYTNNGAAPGALTDLNWGHNPPSGTPTAITGGMLSSDGTTHNMVRTRYVADYFLPFRNTSDYGNTTITDGGTLLSESSQMFTIDYSGLARVSPVLQITSETYNETIARRIDRFVQRRSSSKNTDPTNGPIEAGPFGSLKNYHNMISRNVIYDSLPSRSITQGLTGYCSVGSHGTKAECETAGGTWTETDYMLSVRDVPQAFPFEADDARRFSIDIEEIRIKMKESGSGGPDDRHTSTIITTTDTGIENIGNYTWGYNNTNNGAGTNHSLSVTNYIQDDFKGAQNFRNKSVSDLLIGFGDGPRGRHVVRPNIYDFKALTTSGASNFAREFIMDRPRGARFGQYNTSRMAGTYKFAYNHFGHFRDMLEQSIDTKFTAFIKDERVFGAPVVVNAINIVNPEVPKLLANTSRYNKTANATVTKPYIENNYEGIQQENNLQNETLRVDVPGALRTGQTLSPGNISSGIRRR